LQRRVGRRTAFIRVFDASIDEVFRVACGETVPNRQVRRSARYIHTRRESAPPGSLSGSLSAENDESHDQGPRCQEDQAAIDIQLQKPEDQVQRKRFRAYISNHTCPQKCPYETRKRDMQKRNWTWNSTISGLENMPGAGRTCNNRAGSSQADLNTWTGGAMEWCHSRTESACWDRRRPRWHCQSRPYRNPSQAQRYSSRACFRSLNSGSANLSEPFFFSFLYIYIYLTTVQSLGPDR
jgi:hypothetical protein